MFHKPSNLYSTWILLLSDMRQFVRSRLSAFKYYPDKQAEVCKCILTVGTRLGECLQNNSELGKLNIYNIHNHSEIAIRKVGY